MLPIASRRAAILGPFGINYLLRDLFSTDRAAGAVNGTAAEPGPGTRTVVDGNGVLSIAGGVASFVTGGVSSGDPRLDYGSMARVLGRTLLGRLAIADTNSSGMLGFDTNQTSTLVDSVRFVGAGILQALAGGAAIVVGAYSVASYDVAVIARSAGSYFFIKGDAFTNWTLIWVGGTNNGALFPGIAANGATSTFTADNLRIPDRLYIPPCLAYDTFTRANGALGNSETSGPDGQAVAARAWTGATFAVASNVAVNTPVAGAETLTNGNMESGDPPTNWTASSSTLDGVADERTGGSGAQALSVTATNTNGSAGQNHASVVGTWYLLDFWAKVISGQGSVRWNNSVIASFSGTSWANFLRTARMTLTTTELLLRATNNTNEVRYDDVSVKALALSDLFASLQVSTADVLADVNVTTPGLNDRGIQAGLVLNLDSAVTPANFVIAYLDGLGNAKLDKCVAGVYTSVIIAAVTYSAGATLRVIKDGTSYRLFYNGAAVGSVSTISDAGIVDNTLHGLFSTSPLNSLDHFCVMPRGSNNEFAGLDAF